MSSEERINKPSASDMMMDGKNLNSEGQSSKKTSTLMSSREKRMNEEENFRRAVKDGLNELKSDLKNGLHDVHQKIKMHFPLGSQIATQCMSSETNWKNWLPATLTSTVALIAVIGSSSLAYWQHQQTTTSLTRVLVELKNSSQALDHQLIQLQNQIKQANVNQMQELKQVSQWAATLSQEKPVPKIYQLLQNGRQWIKLEGGK